MADVISAARRLRTDDGGTVRNELVKNSHNLRGVSVVYIMVVKKSLFTCKADVHGIFSTTSEIVTFKH